RWKGAVPDLLLLLEHEPVITLGKSGRAEHIRVSEEELARRGIALHRVDRGGDVTFHGPGQMVAYPILDLTQHGKDVHLYCRRLEEVGLKVLSDYGVSGQRVPGLTGVWVGEEKVMAIGIGVKRWVSLHGVAFNVNTDLECFRLIDPCGIKERGVTSLGSLLKREVPLPEVQERWIHHFSCVFGAKVQRASEADLIEEMRCGRQEALLAGAEGTPA
ncbi:MAG: lipoyl(octanoyl) transferase LipB, partial [candidate division NC10 bacterium]|nr:lipoyl(octanoyl) transferase LipB [candidate division NC10 bacterium]